MAQHIPAAEKPCATSACILDHCFRSLEHVLVVTVFKKQNKTRLSVLFMIKWNWKLQSFLPSKDIFLNACWVRAKAYLFLLAVLRSYEWPMKPSYARSRTSRPEEQQSAGVLPPGPRMRMAAWKMTAAPPNPSASRSPSQLAAKTENTRACIGQYKQQDATRLSAN